MKHLHVSCRGQLSPLGSLAALALLFLPGLILAQPANDDFANRQVIPSVLPVVTSGHNTNATRQPNEPFHDASVAVEATAWFSWTAPASGPIGITFDTVQPSTSLAVYTGDDLTELVHVTSGTFFGLPYSFSATAGTTYQIAIGSTANTPAARYRTFRVTLYDATPPANDNFVNRAPLAGFPIGASANNVHATREAGEPFHAGSFQSRSLWWTWTAPFSGRVGLLMNARTALAVAVYTGDEVSHLVQIAAQFHGGVLPLEVTEGVAYQIAVDASNIYTEGAFTFELMALPENDMFADRIVIPPGGALFTGTTSYSTHEEGEPFYAQNGYAGSVWYTWTPTVSGPTWITTTGSSFPADVFLYTGSSIFDLHALPPATSPAGAVLDAVAGVTYQMSISGFHSGGPFKFGVLRTALNDHFANRTAFSGFSFRGEGWTLLSSAEPGEPGATGSSDSLHSVWWTWTAPVGGEVTFNTEPGNIATLNVFTGTNLNELTAVSMVNGRFQAVAGQSYQIRAANEIGGGVVAFSWNLFPHPSNDAFADRLSLVGTSLVVTGWNFKASREAGEPRHAYFQRYNGDDGYGPMREGRSVWWTWTAPMDGWVRIAPDTSSYDPIIAVYTGDSVRRLKLVSVNLDPMWVSYGGPAEFPARAGTTYQIVVDGRPSGDGRRPVPSEGRITFSLDVTTLSLSQPVNGTILVGPTNLNLRLQVGDTMVDGQMLGALFYTRMIDRPLIPLAVAGPSLEAVPQLLPGYYLLYARATNNQGAVRISAPTAIAVRPVNDEFNNAVRVDGYYATNHGYIGGSTLEKGEPRIGGNLLGSGTVWWSWVAPASGTAKVVIYGADVISAWTGESVRGLKRVAAPNLSELKFKAKAGVRYHFSAARLGQTFFNSGGETTSLMLELKNVELTAPSQGLVVHEGAAVPLAIRTSEPPVNIARVEYLAGTEIIQTSTQPPFSVTWSNAAAGSHAIQAVVVKTTGERLPSNTAGISVRPANDSFANAFVLTGSNVVARGITSTATVETGEPPVSYFGTVWWRWTAPVSGRVIVKNTGSGPFFDLEAYVGTTLSNLVSVSDPPGAIEFQGHLTFRAEEGQTYFLAAEGNGQVEFELKVVEPPANDNFAGRRVTTGLGSIFIVDTFAATSEPGEPAHGDLVRSHSVWFEWTAPRNGTVRLINSGHNYGMAIAVYVGSSLSNLVPVAAIPTSKQDVWLNVSAGQAYAIAVGDRREGVRNIALSINYDGPPGNDNFADATVLLSGALLYSFNGPIVGATRETGEPAHGGAPEGTSVWWSWTPLRSGSIGIAVETSYFVPRVAFYSGSELSSLVALGVGTNGVQLPVVAGTAYYLAIESANGQTGYYSCELAYLALDAFQPAGAPDTTQVALQIRNQLIPGVNGPSVHIVLDGPAGRRVALESSENLLDWKVETELLVSGEVEFPAAPGQRFFRARVLP